MTTIFIRSFSFLDSLVLATRSLHEQEKGSDCPFSSLVVAGATGKHLLLKIKEILIL